MIAIRITKRNHQCKTMVTHSGMLDAGLTQPSCGELSIRGSQCDYRALRLDPSGTRPSLVRMNREVNTAQIAGVVQRHSFVHFFLQRQTQRTPVESGQTSRISTDQQHSTHAPHKGGNCLRLHLDCPHGSLLRKGRRILTAIYRDRNYRYDSPMKSYILWDHDGVLVDTEPLYFEATRLHIAHLGVDLKLPDYLADMALGRSAWERARELGATEEQLTAARAARNVDYQHFLRDRDIEIPGVLGVLETLGRQCAMAIVTTAKRDDFELIHRDRQIVQHMDFVLASGDYPRAKPAPDPYLTALERFAAGPHEAIVVEDSERGLRSAVAAGIDCVVVASEFVRGQNFSTATHQIETLAELPDLLAELNT